MCVYIFTGLVWEVMILKEETRNEIYCPSDFVFLLTFYTFGRLLNKDVVLSIFCILCLFVFYVFLYFAFLYFACLSALHKWLLPPEGWSFTCNIAHWLGTTYFLKELDSPWQIISEKCFWQIPHSSFMYKKSNSYQNKIFCKPCFWRKAPNFIQTQNPWLSARTMCSW